MKFKLIIFSLLACFVHDSHTASKVRTAGSLAIRAVKAHPYASIAAISAGFAARHVYDRYHFYENRAKRLEKQVAQSADNRKLPDEITVHLPDGSLEQLKIKEAKDVDNEAYTSSSFEDLIIRQRDRQEALIIALVYEAGDNRTRFYEADSFNKHFFQGDEIGSDHPRYINSYKSLPYNMHIDQSLGIQYFIYDYRQPEKGFQYLCTYDELQIEGAIAQEKHFGFFNHSSPNYVNKSHDDFVDIFYAHHSDPETEAAQKRKVANKKKLCSEEQAPKESMQEREIRTARAAAQAARGMTLKEFFKQEYHQSPRRRFTDDQIIALGATLLPSVMCLLVAGVNPPVHALNFCAHQLIGTPYIQPKISLYNLLLKPELQEKVYLDNWQDVSDYIKQHSQFFLKGAGIFGGVSAAIITATLVHTWLKARDQEAARAKREAA